VEEAIDAGIDTSALQQQRIDAADTVHPGLGVDSVPQTKERGPRNDQNILQCGDRLHIPPVIPFFCGGGTRETRRFQTADLCELP